MHSIEPNENLNNMLTIPNKEQYGNHIKSNNNSLIVLVALESVNYVRHHVHCVYGVPQSTVKAKFRVDFQEVNRITDN